PVGEQGRETAADVSPAGDRAQIVDGREDAEARERLERPQTERRRPYPAPGKRQTDRPQALSRRLGGPGQGAAAADVVRLLGEHVGELHDGLGALQALSRL